MYAKRLNDDETQIHNKYKFKYTIQIHNNHKAREREGKRINEQRERGSASRENCDRADLLFGKWKIISGIDAPLANKNHNNLRVSDLD